MGPTANKSSSLQEPSLLQGLLLFVPCWQSLQLARAHVCHLLLSPQGSYPTDSLDTLALTLPHRADGATDQELSPSHHQPRQMRRRCHPCLDLSRPKGRRLPLHPGHWHPPLGSCPSSALISLSHTFNLSLSSWAPSYQHVNTIKAWPLKLKQNPWCTGAGSD